MPQAKRLQVQFLMGSFEFFIDSILLTAQPLTAMSTRSISRAGKVGQCAGLTTLPPSCAVYKFWQPVKAYTGIAYHSFNTAQISHGIQPLLRNYKGINYTNKVSNYYSQALSMPSCHMYSRSAIFGTCYLYWVSG
jgi:hypothetical protein